MLLFPMSSRGTCWFPPRHPEELAVSMPALNTDEFMEGKTVEYVKLANGVEIPYIRLVLYLVPRRIVSLPSL